MEARGEGPCLLDEAELPIDVGIEAHEQQALLAVGCRRIARPAGCDGGWRSPAGPASRGRRSRGGWCDGHGRQAGISVPTDLPRRESRCPGARSPNSRIRPTAPAGCGPAMTRPSSGRRFSPRSSLPAGCGRCPAPCRCLSAGPRLPEGWSRNPPGLARAGARQGTNRCGRGRGGRRAPSERSAAAGETDRRQGQGGCCPDPHRRRPTARAEGSRGCRDSRK